MKSKDTAVQGFHLLKLLIILPVFQLSLKLSRSEEKDNTGVIRRARDVRASVETRINIHELFVWHPKFSGSLMRRTQFENIHA